MSYERIEAALLQACELNGSLAEDGEAQCRATIRSGIEAGLRDPKTAPPWESSNGNGKRDWNSPITSRKSKAAPSELAPSPQPSVETNEPPSVAGMPKGCPTGFQPTSLEGGAPSQVRSVFDRPPDPIREWVTTEPQPRQWVFRGRFGPGDLCGLAAAGGTGKGFLLLQLAVSAATGRVLLPSFVPSGKHRVMAFFGEESPEEMHRRLAKIVKAFDLPTKETDLLTPDNLFIHSGRPFGLTAPGEAGTPSSEMERLAKEVGQFSPDLILIDPKSQFFAGLNENDNAITSQWYCLVRRLMEIHPCAVLVSQHVGKMREAETDSAAARGASSNRDDCRFFLNMARPSETNETRLLEAMGHDDMRRVVRLEVSKANYAESGVRMYLERLPGDLVGVLREIPFADERRRLEAEQSKDLLARFVAELGTNPNNHSKRQLSGDGGFRASLGPKVSRSDVYAAIEQGVAEGRICIEKVNRREVPRAVESEEAAQPELDLEPDPPVGGEEAPHE